MAEPSATANSSNKLEVRRRKPLLEWADLSLAPGGELIS